MCTEQVKHWITWVKLGLGFLLFFYAAMPVESLGFYLVCLTLILLLMVGLIILLSFLHRMTYLLSIIWVVAIYVGFLLSYRIDVLTYQTHSLPDENRCFQIIYPKAIRLNQDLPITLSVISNSKCRDTYAKVYTLTLDIAPPRAGIQLVPQSEDPTIDSTHRITNTWQIQQLSLLAGWDNVNLTLSFAKKAENITINLETYRLHAFRLWVKALATSPWTALISGLVSVGSLIGPWVQKERERKREEFKERLMSRPAGLERLQEYVLCRQEDQDLAQEVWNGWGHFEGWEKIALQQAVKLGGKKEDAQAWLDLVGASDQLRKNIETLRDKKPLCTEALLRTYRELGGPHDAVERLIVETLGAWAKTLSAESSDPSESDKTEAIAQPPAQLTVPEEIPEEIDIFDVFDELSKSSEVEALYLLRQICSDLPGNLQKRTESYGYTAIQVFNTPSPDQEGISDFLKKCSFFHHPFGAEQAEVDSGLENSFVSPAVWDELAAPRASCIYAPSGSGHTALARKFFAACPPPKGGESSAKFPVYGLLPGTLMTEAAFWQALLHYVGRTLLTFGVQNPYSFLEHPTPRYQTIARFIRSIYPDPEVLRTELLHTQVEMTSGARRWLRESLEQAVPLSLTPETLLDWLPQVAPLGYRDFYIMLETQGPLTPRLHAFIEEHALRWQTRHIYLKLFEKRREPPPNQLPAVYLQVDLKAMLENRLRAATGKIDSLSHWAREIADPDALLIQAAQGSPRRLMRLGYRLLAAWERSGNEKLTSAEFKEVGLL